MEANRGDIVRMAEQGLQTSASLVIPNLDHVVVSTREEIWLVSSRIVINTVDSLLVRLQREVRSVRGEAPHFDRSIQGSRGKGVGVTRIDPSHHDIMRMPFEDLDAIKVFVPIPQLDAHVVGRAEESQRRGIATTHLRNTERFG
jgi:hypothetical protein